MSGHSKWSTIKRKKGAVDAKRGKIFTVLAREIAVAARESGGDMDSNFRLRLAVDKARGANMPKDNIERAIKRGTGEDKDGVAFEEITYEGYAPHGIALMIECVSDNRNRTVAEIRHILNRYGGSMGEGGSVAWQFARTAYFAVGSVGADYEEVFLMTADAGAEDVTDDDETIEITGPVESYRGISEALNDMELTPLDVGLRMVPTHETALEPDETVKVMKVIEHLEELDDVQSVYSNLHISDAAIAQLEAA
jgi:YebC/PmpR family DNA-binding regulatory protein